MKNKKAVSLYIPVYNEENNIAFLLKSILRQKRYCYILKEVVVVNDGSTDKTKEIVLDLCRKFPIIKLSDDNKRIGKIDRLNQIYRNNKSEILILLDGDLMLKSTNVIEEMVEKFDEKTSIVGANKTPLPAKTFVEKLINCIYFYFYEVRKDINDGKTIHNFSSCAYAITDDFAKKLYYPKNIYPITKFTYFTALKNNLNFKFAKDAYVYFRSPNNLRDYSLQVNRFTNKNNLYKYYPKWAANDLHISLVRKFIIGFKMFFNYPLTFPLAVALRAGMMTQKNKKASGRVWELATSSKKLI